MRKTTALAALGVAAIASLWLWVGIRLACWEGTLSFTASALCDWSWILILVAIGSAAVVLWRLTYDLVEIALEEQTTATSHPTRAWHGYRTRQRREESRARRLALPVVVLMTALVAVFMLLFLAFGPLDLRAP